MLIEPTPQRASERTSCAKQGRRRCEKERARDTSDGRNGQSGQEERGQAVKSRRLTATRFEEQRALVSQGRAWSAHRVGEVDRLVVAPLSAPVDELVGDGRARRVGRVLAARAPVLARDHVG
eukprot:444308-Pleurochrysis_carterae.AAC.2